MKTTAASSTWPTRSPRHRSIAGCCFIGLTVFFVHGSLALDTLVVGGVENTWPDFGTAPGNVIDFATEPGWIAPIQVDPEVNLIEQVRARGGTVSIDSPNSPVRRTQGDQVLQDALDNITNGSVSEVYDRKIANSTFGEHIDIDLGAPLGMDRIVFYPSSLFPRAKPQGMKPLMTHCFLQLLINPDAGEDEILSTGPKPTLTVIAFDPRLCHSELRRDRTPYSPEPRYRVHIHLSSQPVLLLDGGSHFGDFNHGVINRVGHCGGVPRTGGLIARTHY